MKDITRIYGMLSQSNGTKTILHAVTSVLGESLWKLGRLFHIKEGVCGARNPVHNTDSRQFGRMQNGRRLNGRANLVESRRSGWHIGRTYLNRVNNLVEWIWGEYIIGRVTNSVEYILIW